MFSHLLNGTAAFEQSFAVYEPLTMRECECCSPT
jgi:hypothetical protein